MFECCVDGALIEAQIQRDLVEAEGFDLARVAAQKICSRPKPEQNAAWLCLGIGNQIDKERLNDLFDGLTCGCKARTIVGDDLALSCNLSNMPSPSVAHQCTALDAFSRGGNSWILHHIKRAVRYRRQPLIVVDIEDRYIFRRHLRPI